MSRPRPRQALRLPVANRRPGGQGPRGPVTAGVTVTHGPPSPTRRALRHSGCQVYQEPSNASESEEITDIIISMAVTPAARQRGA